MNLSDFDFELPDDLVAQHPPEKRGLSRLLHVPAGTGPFADRVFAELPALLAPGDLLVMNDTRVIKARLHGEKLSGGKVELLVERVLDARTVLGQMRASKPVKPGGTVRFGPATATMLDRDDRFFRLQFDTDVEPLLREQGEMPLPPYIQRPATDADAERYQTVYASQPGAVAAPTAGLHFDEALLARLQGAGVQQAFLTLHVGAGTFQPVQTENVAEHRMHSERFIIPEAVAQAVADTRARGGRVVAVGTTSMRALEASAQTHGGTVRAGEAETDIFITPGYRFLAVDCLITNFHLPKSTLMMLVSAFSGTERIRAAYAHAIAERYRFFSYGDAMLLERA